MARERDVRVAIRDALVATNAFNDVWLSGLPEYCGQGADDLAAAAIEPMQTSLTTGWDAQTAGGLVFTANCTITLMARYQDPEMRDAWAEQLLDYLCNAVNGKTLVAGFTIPGRTIVQSWRWQTPSHPERRIRAIVQYSYLVTWQGFDTTA